jgi:hypothetical protein
LLYAAGASALTAPLCPSCPALSRLGLSLGPDSSSCPRCSFGLGLCSPAAHLASVHPHPLFAASAAFSAPAPLFTPDAHAASAFSADSATHVPLATTVASAPLWLLLSPTTFTRLGLSLGPDSLDAFCCPGRFFNPCAPLCPTPAAEPSLAPLAPLSRRLRLPFPPPPLPSLPPSLPPSPPRPSWCSSRCWTTCSPYFYWPNASL